MKISSKTICSLVITCVLISTASADVLLKDISGQNTSFADLKGKWVFINYWAKWCQTCLDEIPQFNRFYREHKQQDIALFAVNYDDLPIPEQKLLIRRLNITYPNLSNNPARELNLGDLPGVPVTFVFNPQGKLVKTLYGGQTSRDLEAVIATYK